MERTEGGIVLPGPGSMPVDPNDPTKGNLTPVASAVQLTGGVMELYERTDQLAMAVQNTLMRQNEIVSETAQMLENITTLLLAAFRTEDALARLDLDEDAAYWLLKGFLEKRQELRAEAEAARAEEGGDEE